MTAAGEAEKLLTDSFVWDNHSCMPLRPEDTAFLPQLERVKQAGIDAITLNIGMDITSPQSHFEMLDAFESWIARHAGDFEVVTDVHGILRARNNGKLAVVFDVEGMALLDDGNLSQIGELRARGVLWMLVAYNRNNLAGGGCLDDDSGLSAHGRDILREMGRVGMIACCSHTGHRTAAEVLEAAERPVIFSHSNPDAVYSHVRNIPDSLIKLCAQTGGVVGINGVGDFLGVGEDYAELLTRHIDHAVSLVGSEHVGIALDYVFDTQEVFDFIEKAKASFGAEMAAQFSARFAPPESFLAVTQRLLELGYAKQDVANILGGNWLRVARVVADAADAT